tara:strand:- start:181 stop:486 length:306 start_codon:yes stop_codon:yes gene_type:complete
MIVETQLSGEENTKKFIYFNPYKKDIRLHTYNCGWWNDISWEIRHEHDNIILKVPSLEVDNTMRYTGIIDKNKFINGRTYKVILKTLDPEDELYVKLSFIN